MKVSVEYYNVAEGKLFEAYPNYEDLSLMIGKEISIPYDEILSYMLFTEQADDDGWRTYSELKDRVQHRLGDIHDFLDFSVGSIQSKLSPERMAASSITERLGVSLGINTVNKFHDLTEADWAITDNTYVLGRRVKDFDYNIPMASDGNRFIQVENKGAINENNTLKSPSVSQHYASIKEKKNSILARELTAGIPRHRNIYYGTIAVLDNEHTARLWLVDPDALQLKWNPRKFKLIARLVYYSKIFKEIGIHKKIQIALEERIIELVETENIDQFDRIALNTKPSPMTYIQNNNFVSININDAFGTYFFINGIAFIIALPKAIIKLILLQNFEGILGYEFKNAEFSERVSIQLSAKLNKISNESDFIKTEFVFDESRKRYFYQKYQHIRSISSGRIFGEVSNQTNNKF